MKKIALFIIFACVLSPAYAEQKYKIDYSDGMKVKTIEQYRKDNPLTDYSPKPKTYTYTEEDIDGNIIKQSQEIDDIKELVKLTLQRV